MTDKKKRIMEFSLYAYCLSAGLSIAASQVFVCTNILCFILFFLKDSKYSLEIAQVKRAGLLFIFAALFCSIVGIDFSHSYSEILKTLFYFIFPFSVMKSVEDDFSKKALQALILIIISQTLAGLHTLVTTSFPELNLANTPGPVTESGQLVLIIPIAFALYYAQANKTNLLKLALCFCSFLLACYFQPFAAFIIFLLLVVERDPKAFNAIFLAILFAALTVNLKRGPWMGVFFEFILLGILVSRKLIYFSLIGSSLLLLIEPIRERIAALGEHFLIDGGRYSMWNLGIEIFARYPLGLGLNNSNYMQVFDPSLPKTHKHMHNNLLNVAVETGIIGLAAYIFLFYSIFKFAHQLYKKAEQKDKLMILCMALSLFGWQIAGLVEYNFGDSEIKLIALLLVGLLFAKATSLNEKQ